MKSILITQLDFLTFGWPNIIQTGVWRLTFFFGLLAIASYLIAEIKLYWPAKIFWLYCISQALFIVEFPSAWYGLEHTAFQAMAGANLAEIIMIPLFVLFISDRKLQGLLDAMKWAMVAELICVWFKLKGLMMAPSFNCALVALYLPIAVAPVWLWLFATVTIFTHHAGAAQAMMCVQFLVVCWNLLPRRYFFGLSIFSLPALLAIVYYHSNGPMLDGLGRLDRLFGRFQYFWAYGDPSGATHMPQWKQILLGVGPSTFTWLSMKIDNFQDPVVLFMHNDFAQISWELGIVGFILAMIVYVRAIYDCRKLPMPMMALLSLIPMGMIWHPLRFFPSAILVAILFKISLIKKEIL